MMQNALQTEKSYTDANSYIYESVLDKLSEYAMWGRLRAE